MLRHLWSPLAWALITLTQNGCSKAPAVEQPNAELAQARAREPAIPYERWSGGAVFQRSARYVQEGYEVESGVLIAAGQRDGVVVSVSSPDGALLAWIEEPDAPERSGTWQVSPEGVSHFSNAPRPTALKVDASEAQGGTPAVPARPQADGSYTVDVLAGYSRAAASTVDDPVADALLQVESANLQLRQHAIKAATLRLADVQIVDDDFGVVAPVLGQLDTLFRQGLDDSGADVIAGYSTGHALTASGWGQAQADRWVNWIDSPSAFGQGLAHAAETDQAAGGASTPSAPGVEPLARRLASYAPGLRGERLIVASVNADASATLTLPTLGANRPVGIVVVDPVTHGPRALDSQARSYTPLVARLTDRFGVAHAVLLRGERVTACSVHGLAFNAACLSGEQSIGLRISLVGADNPNLAAGMLTGKMTLRALDSGASNWGTDITVLLSVNRPATAPL